MSIICVCGCFLLAILAFARDKKIYSMAGCYFTWFGVIVFFARLQLFDLYEISNKVYFYIVIGTLFFYIGTAIVERVKISSNIYFLADDINKSALKTYILIVLFLYIPTLTRALKLILQGNNVTYIYILLNAINDGETNAMSKTAIEVVLESYLLMPVYNLLIPVTLMLAYKQKKIKFLCYSVLLLLIRVATSGTRNAILIFCEDLLLLIIIFKSKKYTYLLHKNNALNRKFKRVFIIIILVAVYVIAKLTFERGIENLFESLYFYYPGALAVMDAYLKQYSNTEPTFGFLSLMGFLNPFFSLFEHWGIMLPSAYYRALEVFHGLQNIPVMITPTHEANVFVTNIFYFYIDGGIVGIIIGAIIYGMLSQKIFLNLKKKETEKNVALFVYYFSMIILMSHMRMQFSLMHIALAFVYFIPLFLNKQKTID